MSEMIKSCPDTRIYLKDIFFYKFDLLVVLSFLPRFVLHLFKEKFFPHNGLAAEFRKAVGETYLHLLKKNIDDKTIAFFYPTEALRDHFDRIPNLLAQNKIKTINLYGTAKNDDLERQKILFMLARLKIFSVCNS